MIAILMYHQIADVPAAQDPHQLAVPPGRFAQQMALLHARGYRTLSLAEAADIWERGGSEPDKAVVLTFDDGYRDFYTAAYPVLQRYGFTASVFLVTDLMNDRSGWDGESGSPLLTWDEVRELRRNGISFGSHTRTHPHLTTLSDAEARAELFDSKQAIEEELGAPVDFITYPYGDRDARIRDITAQCGYRAACSVAGGDWDMFNLLRATCMTRDTPTLYMSKARGWYRHRLRLRSWRNRLIPDSLRRMKQTLSGAEVTP